MFSFNLNRPSVAQDVGSVVLSTAAGAGLGYIVGLCGRTNVLASTLILGTQFCITKTTEVLANRFLGEYTRDGKIVKAIGNFLALTLSYVALKSFDLIGNGTLIVGGALALAIFAYQLYDAGRTPATWIEQLAIFG